MSECIEYWGYIGPDGYGEMPKRLGRDRAQRHFWRECFGPIPEGHLIHHVCDNRACVNPEHLAAWTRPQHGRHHALQHDQAAIMRAAKVRMH